MSDRELLDALTVLARRLGLIDDARRVAFVDAEPTPRDAALCLMPRDPDAHGVALLCSHVQGHGLAHSWAQAFVGIVACGNRSWGHDHGGANVRCTRQVGHGGEHKATAADGVRWTWGDSPMSQSRSRADAAVCGQIHALRPIGTGALTCAQPSGHTDPHKDARGIAWPNDNDPRRCTAVEWGTNGHRGRCWLPAGHTMAHTAQDSPDAANQMFQWRDGEPAVLADPSTESGQVNP